MKMIAIRLPHHWLVAQILAISQSSLGLMAAMDKDDGNTFTYLLVGGADIGHVSISGNEGCKENGIHAV